MPALGQLRGAGEEHRMRSVLVRIMALSGGAVMVATAAFALFLHWMIPTLYGEAARPALDLVWWLFVACTIAGFAVGSESFYIVIDRIDVAVKISVTFVAITAPIGYFMIQSWHATGAAAFIALVHGSAATSVAYVFYYLSKPHGHAPVAPPAPEKLSA
jgi:O-antigen/teichoic acid export membrane protein